MHAYTEALLREIVQNSDSAREYAVDSVFFGGGTPTLLPNEDVQMILCALRENYSIDAHAEISMEANPATADAEKLAFLSSLGINRLSIGVQSMCDEELASLGRVHFAKDAERIFHDARRAHFENINIDLMYGIPGQTEESFSQTLSAVCAMAPEHISAYSLIIEEGTPFYRMQKKLTLPSEEEEEALHTLLLASLADHGYEHYEISNYAKPGYACRHNLHYWRMEPYLGFGAAAYSFFDGMRFGNTRDIDAYMKDPCHAIAERETPFADDLAYESIMLGFRLAEGIDTDAYFRRFGVRIEEKFQDIIASFRDMRLLDLQKNRLFLTEKGMRLSNSILVAFLQKFELDKTENNS